MTVSPAARLRRSPRCSAGIGCPTRPAPTPSHRHVRSQPAGQTLSNRRTDAVKSLLPPSICCATLPLRFPIGTANEVEGGAADYRID